MVWDDTGGVKAQRLGEHAYRIGTIFHTPEGTGLIAVDYTRITVYDAATGRRKTRIRAGHWIFTAALAPDGNTLATGGEKGRNGGAPGWIRLFDWNTGEKLADLRPGKNTQLVSSLAFSPDGATLAAAIDRHRYDDDDDVTETGPGNSVQLWDVASREIRIEIEVAGETLAFSPDGRLLAIGSAGAEGRVRLCDAADGTPLDTLDAAGPILFSPDGRLLITANPSRDVLLVWDVADRELIRTIPNLGPPLTVSPDGRTLVASEGDDVVLYDLNTGHEQRRLLGLNYGAACASFSPDGSSLATGGGFRDENEGVVVWRAEG